MRGFQHIHGKRAVGREKGDKANGTKDEVPLGIGSSGGLRIATKRQIKSCWSWITGGRESPPGSRKCCLLRRPSPCAAAWVCVRCAPKRARSARPRSKQMFSSLSIPARWVVSLERVVKAVSAWQARFRNPNANVNQQFAYQGARAKLWYGYPALCIWRGSGTGVAVFSYPRLLPLKTLQDPWFYSVFP